MSIKLNELQNNFIINNSFNYKETLHYTWKEIIDKYFMVVIEYLTHIFESAKIKNINTSKYIIICGLETITHVFCNLLYFTKNLNMTYYNTQKAFYYYFEFIDQISEEQISYLKLNSNDAILYVYKKTIYQINNEFRKNMKKINEKDACLFRLLNEYVYLIKTFIINIVYRNFMCINISVNNCVENSETKNNENIINEIKKYYTIIDKQFENPVQQLEYLNKNFN